MSPQEIPSFEAWWVALRKQCGKQLPLESGFSLPVPVRAQDSKYELACFFYAVHRGSLPGNGTARPPIARLLAVYPTGMVLQFTHVGAGPLFEGLPESGSLGPLTTGGTNPTERMKQRKALFDLYPGIIHSFLEPEMAQVASNCETFRKLFFTLAEPGLLPYYQALNPNFFAWLDAQ